MTKVIYKKMKGTTYSTHCRNCNFSDTGNTRNIVNKAKEHCKKKGHDVEYYIENGKVFKIETL